MTCIFLCQPALYESQALPFLSHPNELSEILDKNKLNSYEAATEQRKSGLQVSLCFGAGAALYDHQGLIKLIL